MNKGHHNSPEEQSFYSALLVSAYHDVVGASSPQSEIDRDIEEIRTRSRHEGQAFLTKSLPSLGKSCDVSLATGEPLKITGFKLKPMTSRPCFMQSLFGRLFRDDGVPWFATWYADMLSYRENPAGYVEAYAVSQKRAMQYTSKTTRRLRWSPDTLGDLYDRFQRLTPTIDVVGSRTYPGSHVINHLFPELDDKRLAEVRIRLTAGPPNDLVCLERSDAFAVECLNGAQLALSAIRQVSFMYYKLNVPYSSAQEAAVIRRFVLTESEIQQAFTAFWDAPELSVQKQVEICNLAHGLISRVLANADPYSGFPKHGPGSVATGEKPGEKHVFKRYYRRLAERFDYTDWFFCNADHLADSLREFVSMEELEAGTAKVVLVPKDSRGPRLISCEPLEYQWIQQALMSVLVSTIESHRLTKGRVNFTLQSVNQRKASEGSVDFRLVTLDMKDASDRVHLSLVRALFPTRWYDALYASRSSATTLPDGTVIELDKFAPMGSAVCFPVEALVFWALAVAAQHIYTGVPLVTVANDTYVYGDDIICKAENHSFIASTFEVFGLKVNDKKCCTAGPFKESCGSDYYYGSLVTPLRVREVWCRPTRKSLPKPSWLAGYVAFANACYARQLYATADAIVRAVNQSLVKSGWWPVPFVTEGNSSCIAFVVPHLSRPELLALNKGRVRYSARYQYLEVLGYGISQSTEQSTVYGWELLTRILASQEPQVDTNQVSPAPNPTKRLGTGEYPIAHRVKLKRAWTRLCL